MIPGTIVALIIDILKSVIIVASMFQIYIIVLITVFTILCAGYITIL